jgi:hypothetical protein
VDDGASLDTGAASADSLGIVSGALLSAQLVVQRPSWPRASGCSWAALRPRPPAQSRPSTWPTDFFAARLAAVFFAGLSGGWADSDGELGARLECAFDHWCIGSRRMAAQLAGSLRAGRRDAGCASGS